jgi:membrane protein implicated in regulation of membrane protease activity
MKKLWVAMGAFAVLMVLTLITIDDQKFRLAALVVLAMFAIRTWTHSRKQQHEQESSRGLGENDE